MANIGAQLTGRWASPLFGGGPERPGFDPARATGVTKQKRGASAKSGCTRRCRPVDTFALPPHHRGDDDDPRHDDLEAPWGRAAGRGGPRV